MRMKTAPARLCCNFDMSMSSPPAYVVPIADYLAAAIFVWKCRCCLSQTNRSRRQSVRYELGCREPRLLRLRNWRILVFDNLIDQWRTENRSDAPSDMPSALGLPDGFLHDRTKFFRGIAAMRLPAPCMCRRSSRYCFRCLLPVFSLLYLSPVKSIECIFSSTAGAMFRKILC